MTLQRSLFVGLTTLAFLGFGNALGQLSAGEQTLSRVPSRTPSQVPEAKRIVSLNPSLTSIVVALGAGARLVGVDEFSARQEPSVATLPRVGGFYDPSLEAVVALHPDLVIAVPSLEQREFRRDLERLGISLLALDPKRFDEVLTSIEVLGARIGRWQEAFARVAEIRRVRAHLERATAGRPRPRTVLILQRDPLYVAGAGSFIDEMLSVLGADNLAAEFPDPYPRLALEWLVAAKPEVILDSSPEPEGAERFWSRWPSLPAVTQKRVIALDPGVVTLPGPYLDRALRTLAAALHGSEVARALETTP